MRGISGWVTKGYLGKKTKQNLNEGGGEMNYVGGKMKSLDYKFKPT